MTTHSTLDPAAALRPDALEPGDRDLVTRVGAALESPREAPADSFVLHAPLELCARVILLGTVPEGERGAARDRIAEMLELWEAHSPGIAPPAARDVPSDGPAAIAALLAGIDASDLDGVDAAALGVARHVAPEDLAARLVDALAARTSAAAHAPIFLQLFPAVAALGVVDAAILRPLARDLARNPDWAIRWADDLVPTAPSAAGLFDAVATAPAVDHGGVHWIHPTMMRVDVTGIAAAQLADVVPAADLAGATRALARAATGSMLQDDESEAPYGWTHALTMPWALLQAAPVATRPARIVAIAATHLVGFRSSLARRPLRADWDPATAAGPWRVALDGTGPEAAAAVRAAPAGEHREIVRALCRRAAAHPDAHLAKYTVTGCAVAAADPERAAQHLAAVAHLHGVWNGLPLDPGH